MWWFSICDLDLRTKLDSRTRTDLWTRSDGNPTLISNMPLSWNVMQSIDKRPTTVAEKAAVQSFFDHFCRFLGWGRIRGRSQVRGRYHMIIQPRLQISDSVLYRVRHNRFYTYKNGSRANMRPRRIPPSISNERWDSYLSNEPHIVTNKRDLPIENAPWKTRDKKFRAETY